MPGQEDSPESPRQHRVATLSLAIGLMSIVMGVGLIVWAALPADTAARDSRSGETPGVPRLELDTNVVDFGVVQQTDVATATVTITNTGDSVLRIERLEST